MKEWQAFVEEVRAAQAKMDFGVGEECFYRGVADSRRDLAPSLFRIKQDEARERHVLTLEYDLFFEFKARARELHHEALNDWDWLFYMRHYGLPTRLLDWTEALGVAVFFAVQNHSKKDKNSPCVWLLNPYALNKQSWGVRGLIAPENLGYDPTKRKSWTYEEILLQHHPEFGWKLPVGIYPMQRALRMHAQRGWFTIHGDDLRPLNKIIISDVPAGKILQRIDLAPAAVEEAHKFLETAGINAYSLFPDLDGLSRELHHKYGITYQ